ncbi:pentatricopeptide repeat-containing protein At2g36980, mitochondrial [Humulus lupulus]|uniref:pentatricopeptide repeat-containing protein At2g36980, mitochondrial n=1 Tax=Humulus lupulus TaxID=3486 RepID=UPI002B4031BE|nr:pentatricopeptide repeat-containing protein At2g36980, mitochondrial [Humulus lupulus]
MQLEVIRVTSKIVAYAKSGQITHARKLFDGMSHRDSVAWNAMLASYSQLGLHQEALSLFWSMRIMDTRPDHFTFTSTLSACAGACELRHGTKVHALILVLGYQSYVPINNAMIDMYGKCLSPSSATRVFDEMNLRNDTSWCSLLFARTKSFQFDIAYKVFLAMPRRVEIAWNIMIAGYARNGEIERCLALLKDMLENSCWPDQWTFSSLMSACTESSECLYGFMVHTFIIKSGWSSAVETRNSLLSFYAELGCRGDAMKVFDSPGNLSQVSWNAIIDANMKLGDTEDAFLAFHKAPEKNIVSWTSMISGYARNGHGEQAVSFFVEMMRNGFKSDDYAIGAVLHACSTFAVLGHGKMIHGCIFRNGFHGYVYAGNGLVNMYAKCGDLEGSNRAFGEIPDKDLVSWNAMLFAFGLHGKPNQALKLYKKMVATGVKPDKVTFIGLLMTCSHSGLIEESREFYETMKSVYELSPEMDHVACMVDMLARGGYISEAKELATKYLGTVSSELSSFEALLGACSAHQDFRLGTYLGKALKDLDPHKEISYVMLSNLYCASGQWNEAEIVRQAMLDKGVKKMPGCSWIELRNKVTTFVAGDHYAPHKVELHKILNSLEFEMKNPCLVSFEN